MGCSSFVEIGDNLVFSICTHDPGTGVLTDADADPTYRIYEDETGTPILTGTMSKLDDGNTTGFYTELIACTSGNGFENGKNYTIYITATVDSDTSGIAYSFKAVTPLATQVNAEVLDVLNVDTHGEPGQEDPPSIPTMRQMIHYLYKAWRNKGVQTTLQASIYNDAGDTVDHKAATSDTSGVTTKNKWATGP